MSKNSPLFHDFSKVIIKEGLPIDTYENDDEKMDYGIMFHYSNQMTYIYIPFIIEIFNNAFNSGKLTLESFLTFIKDKT